MIVAIDFDGTIAEHEFPEIGPEVPGAIDRLKSWQRQGHRLMLWTMRSGDTLEQAVQWCAERGLHFWAVNENPEQQDTGWSTSNKQYAHRYIDDAAVGCPLTENPYGRPYVDWSKISL